MYRVLFAVALFNLCGSEEKNHHIDIKNFSKSTHGISKNSNINVTFIDKDENLLLKPKLDEFFEEHKAKKKIKKSPKRTIQKIIKKNKGKFRKVYFNQVTKESTVPPKIDFEKIYGKEEVKKWNSETTTHSQHRHKNRNMKVTRYHMPFHKLQKNKEERRHKRSLSRELYILKDLDQIEFLSKENGNDVVNAHIADYWII